jgi:hypothetical protein
MALNNIITAAQSGERVGKPPAPILGVWATVSAEPDVQPAGWGPVRAV